ncbi:MAG TPA: XkdF-like putative serine protease domain-containing protein [Stellaceae bacterium]|jgi:hypothetical protein|nr:XkdF-like putative serine protease domain-containing protein [Stellaceae bacterium]
MPRKLFPPENQLFPPERDLFTKRRRVTNAAKADAEPPTMCWGWASLSSIDGKKVVDAEGDYIPIEALAKAAHAFMTDRRTGCALHMRDPDNPSEPVKIGTVLESLVVTDELAKALGADFGGKRGWWIGMRIDCPDVARAVKKGMLAQFSIGGSGRRFPIE